MGAPVSLPHSGLGTASFIISIPVGILLFVIFVIAGVMETTMPGGMDEESPMVILVGLCMLGLMGLDVIAFGLGIAGLCQRHRRKMFAVLGILFSTMVILGTIALMVIGSLAA
jgi:hypothetical protein